VKTLASILMLLGMLSLASCSAVETVYVRQPYEVLVPVPCVVPNADCSFDRNTSAEVLDSLLECIVDMKRNEEKCSGR